uniref:Uncharacterized protein n=1 Tax=Rhizophora mucronata TaxID=61149 RepID=A0A2P2NVH7_RHIMU
MVLDEHYIFLPSFDCSSGNCTCRCMLYFLLLSTRIMLLFTNY